MGRTFNLAAVMTTSRIITRRELYDLVWSKPMTSIASELGLSDVGLAKICDRHRVPKPPRGYWAKLQAGKKVKQIPFIEADDPQVERIKIAASLMQLPEATREIVQRARAERKAAKAAPRPHTELPPTVEPIQEVHHAVRRTAQALRKAKPDANGAVRAIGEGLCGIVVSRATVERVVAFLDSLARKLEAKSLPLVPAGEGMRVSVGPESATFTLKERTRREKHVPTPEDLAAEERRQKKLERYWSSRSWDASPVNMFERAYPEFDVIYTGELVLQVEGYGDGVRRTWADGRTQTVESLSDDIVVGLQTLLDVRKAGREEREERQRQREHLARRRDLARQRSKREENRLSYLNSIINLHREIDQLRGWLAVIELKLSPRTGDDFRRMIDWARNRLTNLEATIDPGHVDQDLKDKKLFPETDELHDPEGGPPDEPRYW